MSRNDGSLYTGMNSSSFASVKTHKVVADRKALADKKRESRSLLTPSEELIDAVIIRERELVMKKLALLNITLDTSEASLLAHHQAVQMNLEFIDRFNAQIKNVMRTGAM